MKNLNTIILVLYFLVLLGGSIIFYYRFYPNVIDPVTSGQRIISGDSNQTIFFLAEDNLYRLFSENSLDRLGGPRMEIIAQKVTLNNLVTGNNRDLYFDNQKDLSKIVKLNLGPNTLSTLFSNERPGLNNFNSFLNPKITTGKDKILFKAIESTDESLFYFNIPNDKIVNLTANLGLEQIYDYEWANNNQSVIVAGATNNQYLLVSFNLETHKKEIIKQSESKIDQIRWVDDTLYFLKDDNLSSINLKNQAEQTINLAVDKHKVTSYDISDNKEFIVLEVKNTQTGETNLKVCQSNGSNLIDLTTDGISSLPVFLKNSNEIVFWKKGSGLYKNSINQVKEIKLINLTNNIEQIFAWR